MRELIDYMCDGCIETPGSLVCQECYAPKIVNLTPHAVRVQVPGPADAENWLEIPASGTIARVSAKTVKIGFLPWGIDVTSTEFGEVENLPDPEPGTFYIVSSLVAQRVPDRDDVFIPNEAVRDEQGRIVGCKSLGRI